MTQIAQLSAADIEARFHITGARPVAFLLAGFARDSVPFSVQFGGELFLTTLLAVQPDKGLLIFDCSGSTEINRRFLASGHSVFVGRPDGIHVQFSVGKAWETMWSGTQAFVVALPPFVVRLQRREFFRIETPRGRPLEFFGRLPSGGLLKQPVHDLSVAGVGVSAIDLPSELVVGLVLPIAHFALPEDGRDCHLSVTVAHLTECEGRAGHRQWRIGLRFNDLPPAEEIRIQRAIARIERDRHELA